MVGSGHSDTEASVKTNMLNWVWKHRNWKSTSFSLIFYQLNLPKQPLHSMLYDSNIENAKHSSRQLRIWVIMSELDSGFTKRLQLKWTTISKLSCWDLYFISKEQSSKLSLLPKYDYLTEYSHAAPIIHALELAHTFRDCRSNDDLHVWRDTVFNTQIARTELNYSYWIKCSDLYCWWRIIC